MSDRTKFVTFDKMKPELVGCKKIGGIRVLLKHRANGRNIVPHQLPTLLRVVASVCMELKVK